MKKRTGWFRPGDGSGERGAAARTPRASRLVRSLACCLAVQLVCAPFLRVAEAGQGGAATGAHASVPAADHAADGATAVGTVPPPGPASVSGPQSAEAPLAAVQPTLTEAQQKQQKARLSTQTPTTADPGTLVPGGRRQTLTFADFGAQDPLQLRGTDSQNGVPFSVRDDEVVTGAVLHLIYSYSPALLPDLSQLKVLLNGEVAATLPLPREQAGLTLSRDIAIDPRFITEYNHLNLQLIGHYTRSCEDPAHSSLWATVSNASSLDLTYAPLPAKPDLAMLPEPFFDRRDVRRLELPFVFAAQPDADTLVAAGTVASWFGSLARYRGALFPAHVGDVPPTGNAVVFALPAAPLDGIALPPVTGPTLAVVPRPAPAEGELLLVMGRNAAELRTAASALALGQGTLSGTSATVSELTTPKPREPYDAPRWLPTNRPVRLGELADRSDPGALSMSGYFAGPISLNMHVPPDLFMWNTPGARLDLRYRYTVRPKPDRSSLNISVNDNFVQAFPIPAVAPSRYGLTSLLGRLGIDETSGQGVARRIVHVPPLLLPPRSALHLHFFYDIPATGACAGRLMPNVAGSISPDSTIDLSSFPHYMALPDLAAFANSGFPFTRMADLSRTAVILPNAATPDDYSLYLLAMGRMGESTGYPVTGVSVGTAAEVERFADKDLLMLGGPGRQPLLQTWAKSMPFSDDGETRRFTLSDLAYWVEDWWHGPVGVERVPARADLSLVSNGESAMITGFQSPLRSGRSVVALITSPGASQAAMNDALLDADILPSIQGAMVVIHGRAVTVTSNGQPYFVGRLPFIAYLRWILSSHPLLLMLGGVVAALVFAALFYRMLRAIAARRLKD